jgi:hypothetical protein
MATNIVARKLGAAISEEDAAALTERDLTVKVKRYRVPEGMEAVNPWERDGMIGVWQGGASTVWRRWGGKTIVEIHDPRPDLNGETLKIAEGTAVCHFRDQWNRKLGLKIATQRALKDLGL